MKWLFWNGGEEGGEWRCVGREEGSTLYVHILQWEKDRIPRAIFFTGGGHHFFLGKGTDFSRNKNIVEKGGGVCSPPLLGLLIRDC